MANTTLGTPLADDAIRDINFFNGRLLTGGDLQREQSARRLADSRVGQAGGPGIGWGLEVTALAGSPAGRIKVSPGLGVSPSGQVLCLATEPTVQLVAPPPEATAAVVAGFGPCGTLAGAAYVAGDGLFLLTLAPVTLAEGKAPVLALDAVNTRCSTDAFVEAVQFRLLRINGFNPTGTGAAAVARLRSEVAWAFFGPQGQAAAHRQPGSAAAAGRLATMFSEGLSVCDVPLAVVYLRDDAIIFVDRWAVRRRLAADAASSAWAAWLGERVCALGEAQLAQFQDHIADTPAVLGGAATAALAWLPPAGFLPAATNWAAFLGPRAPAREVALAAADAPDVLAGALRGDAVDLSAAATPGAFRVYRIDGSGGPLLFVRDGRNLHHAEQLWLDGARAGLPGASEVQTAIDRLRAGTCLHLALRPDMDVAGALAALPAGQDVTLCFERGDYRMKAPLQLTGLGRVHLHGPGASLVNAAGECALRILQCAAAEVHDIAFTGRAAGSGKDELDIGLHGALTIVDTPQVGVQRISASCVGDGFPAAAALVVTARAETLAKLPPMRFQVSDCELAAGPGQHGLLCINGETVRITGNQVSAVGGKGALQRGIVVGGRQAGSVHIAGNRVRDVVRGITVGTSEASDADAPPLQAERITVERNRVDLQLQDVGKGGRYGILIGNAGSVLACGNHVTVLGGDVEALGLHALRLAGSFGPQIVVRDNLFEDGFKGIVFQPLLPTNLKALAAIWAFQCNVALRSVSVVLEVPEALRELVIDEHNRRVPELAGLPNK